MFTSSGIDALGRLSWGTHFCHFYEDDRGIIDALIPYFRAGLDNQEQCLWITAPPLGIEGARAALRTAVPDLAERERRGDIEIVHHEAWGHRMGAMGADAVVRDWMSREQTALSLGHRGLRLSGNMTALHEAAHAGAAAFEAQVHDLFHGKHIVALCSYCAAKHGSTETIDILRHHEFALARRADAWEVWEGLAPIRTHGGGAASDAVLQALPAAIYTTDTDGRLTFYNDSAAELWGQRPNLGDAQWCGSWKLYWPDGTPMKHEESPMAVALKENRAVRGAEALAGRPDGTRVAFIPYPTPLHDSSGKLVGAVNVLVDITERKALEERLELYAREVGHRAQNLLASVTAILRLTKAPDHKSFVDTVCGRINAFARVHHLIGGAVGGRAGLQAVASQTLAAYAGQDRARVVLEGPDLSLSLDESQGLAMILHELATNSVKYGALSESIGQVHVTWSLVRDTKMRLIWRDVRGPLVEAPTSRGFGTRLIEATAADKLKGEATFDWRYDGLVCEITASLSAPFARTHGSKHESRADSRRGGDGASAAA
jgi:PAS domain S-box-containing protein